MSDEPEIFIEEMSNISSLSDIEDPENFNLPSSSSSYEALENDEKQQVMTNMFEKSPIRNTMRKVQVESGEIDESEASSGCIRSRDNKRERDGECGRNRKSRDRYIEKRRHDRSRSRSKTKEKSNKYDRKHSKETKYRSKYSDRRTSRSRSKSREKSRDKDRHKITSKNDNYRHSNRHKRSNSRVRKDYSKKRRNSRSSEDDFGKCCSKILIRELESFLLDLKFNQNKYEDIESEVDYNWNIMRSSTEDGEITTSE